MSPRVAWTVLLTLPLLVAALLVVDMWRPWDPRLSAAETERALPDYVGKDIRFNCDSAGNDGTVALGDVDYLCYSTEVDVSYWVATDDERIAGVQFMG